MHLAPDPRRLTSLERLLREFWDLMKAANDPALFEGQDFTELEKRLIRTDTDLSAAQGCINAMTRVWPDGQDIYDRFLLAITELSNRRHLAEEFAYLLALNLPQHELIARHRAIIAKNREALMIAGTYMAEAADILFEQTGIRLNAE
jgi:hypothetical protein